MRQAFFLVSTVIACALIPLSSWSQKIHIAAYNVQNLFDNKHDEGKYDFDFLPINDPDWLRYCGGSVVESRNDPRACTYPLDWTRSKLNLKLSQIKSVFHERGKPVDILLLSEIENRAVARMLATRLGFDRVMLSEGPDRRGIDTAILFRSHSLLKLSKVFFHSVPVGFATRKIVEAEFSFKDGSEKRLFVYANHWPAQGSSGSGPRMAAARTLKRIIADRKRNFKKSFFLVGGDFNVTKNEKPHPFRDELLRDDNYGVELHDVHALYGRAVANHQLRSKAMPKGTYFYAREKKWSLFDRFFVSSNLLNRRGLRVDIPSYEIYASHTISRFSKTYGKIPFRYNFRAKSIADAGFSDHYPIFVDLKL